MNVRIEKCLCGSGLVALTAAAAFAAPPGFQGLGGLFADPNSGAVQSRVSAISGDGFTAVGTSTDQAGRVRPFRWTPTGGMVALTDAPGSTLSVYHEVGGVSADGSQVAGTIYGEAGCSTAARWISSALPEQLDQAACVAAAFGISASGAVIVGDLYGATSMGFVWRREVPQFYFFSPLDGYTDSSAKAVGAEGALIAGTCNGRNGSQAVVWENGSHFPRGLGYLPNTDRFKIGRATAISPDGAYIIGASSSTAAGPEGVEGFMYSMPSGPMTGLGPATGGRQTYPTAVCRHAEVIVGSLVMPVAPYTQTAFIWTPAAGLRELRQVLATDYSIDMQGWTLTEATGISGDGSVIVGNGVGPHGEEAWLATLPAAVEPCIADFNNDGGVDGNDVAAFFMAWIESDPSADANKDGGIDGADVEAFFVPWQAGGC